MLNSDSLYDFLVLPVCELPLPLLAKLNFVGVVADPPFG